MECTPRVSPNVNHGLWEVKCPCRCAVMTVPVRCWLTREASRGGAQGVWGLSVLSLIFAVNVKVL